jgi:riboflavin kinase/FMN adenylyltransferase
MSALRATGIEELPQIGEAAICMGVFDGVHRGHQVLLEATVEAAQCRGVKAAALVFDPHPDEVIRPGRLVARLAPLHENLRRLREAGIEAALPVRFDQALRDLTAEEFLLTMAPGVQVRALIMSPESAFGRDRAGTAEAMEAFGRSTGFEVVRVEGLVTERDEPISSGRIRRALAEGAVDDASRLLGHPPYLEGNFAADNKLEFAYFPAFPAPGQYRVAIRGGLTSPGVHAALLTISPDSSAELLVDEPMGTEPIGLDLLS